MKKVNGSRLDIFPGKTLKSIVSAILALVLVCTSLCSCHPAGNAPETFTEDKKQGTEWDRYTFMTDSFSYTEVSAQSGRESTKTAVRIIKLNNETGEISHVCIDPVCTHEPYSGCPLVSAAGLSCWVHSLGDWLVFYTETSSAASEITMSLYNLKTGEVRELLRQKKSEDQIHASSFNGIVYAVIPDLENGKTVYRLKSYAPGPDKWTTLSALDEDYYFPAITNKRIYLSLLTTDISYSDTPSFSLDHNGENRREEPAMKMAINIRDGEYCCGAQYRDLQFTEGFGSRIFAGYYVKYDLNTRETTRVPVGEGATVLGLWNDGYVYATCRDVEKAVGLNIYEYAAEHGLDPYDPSVRQTVNQLRIEMMFGDRMYIKTCDANGENSKVLYEYPGIFIDSGSVSGDYMTVKLTRLNGQTLESGQIRIDLNTGKFEAVPVYTLGDLEGKIIK